MSSKKLAQLSQADAQRLKSIIDYFDKRQNQKSSMSNRNRPLSFPRDDATTSQSRKQFRTEPKSKKRRPVQQQQRRTHLMEHLTPLDQKLVHEYYQEIGRKGGRHRGGVSEDEAGMSEGELGYDPRVHPGYLEESRDEAKKRAVHNFLHAVQTKKNYGEEQAESELDEMEAKESDENDEDELDEEDETDESSPSDEDDYAPPALPTRRGQSTRPSSSSRPQQQQLSARVKSGRGGGSGSGGSVSKKPRPAPRKRSGPLAEILVHMTPREQEAVHRYYRHINRLRGSGGHVKGFLAREPIDEQNAVHKFLHYVGVGRHYGEEEAISELEESEQEEEASEQQQQQQKEKQPKAASKQQPSTTASKTSTGKKSPSKKTQQQQPTKQPSEETVASQRTEEPSQDAAAASAKKKPAAQKKAQSQSEQQQQPQAQEKAATATEEQPPATEAAAIAKKTGASDEHRRKKAEA